MKNLKDRYEDIGPRWRQDFGSIRRPDLFSQFIQVVNPGRDALAENVKMLGLMSGDAGFELYFARHLVGMGKKVELDILDFSPNMLEVAKPAEHIVLRKIVGDVRSSPIESENDLVIFKFGPHDLPAEDQSIVFQKIPRLMRKDGRLVLITYYSPTSEAQIHYNNIVELKDCLAGYKSRRHFATLGEIIDEIIKANLKPRIEMLSESKINYFQTELLGSEAHQAFSEKLYQMNLMFGINAMLGINENADGPEITFPLVIITAKK